ncbi:tyrosine-type recombinase/integrase [Oryzihumus leptocrescens]|uniref:Site-specific recombinase XerD n=1 Tax=Oryzihumus leptocrescens TaxID=297536 RepID=A0A542ZI97_9MICO|nr:site-specific integrase [Oryzihumus leptocrescens]TQL60071.1 site-specific recombinase XerD [Oryzihumus leptocrescens]
MTTAGSPATPDPQQPRPDATPAAPGGPSAFAVFRAAAAHRRSQHTRDHGRPEAWADPDPAAILALPAGRHPVDRVLARQKAGRSRANFRYKLAGAHARLAGMPGRSVTGTDPHSFPWHHLDADAAAEYRREVYRAYPKQSSRNDAVSVVRRVVTQCHRVGLISALRRDELLEELYTVAPGPSTKRRRLAPSEVAALLAACEDQPTPKGAARDTAIVALLRTTGMRVGELAGLDLADWERADQTMCLRDTKNGRDHLVFLHPDAVPYLDRWLGIRGHAPGALFTPLPGHGLRHLNPNYIQQRIQLHARTVGIPPFGCHDFRRTFATELLRSHDVALVGKLLNHTKLSSTLIYDLADEDEQRAAVASLDLPSVAGRPVELPHVDGAA